MDSSRVRFTKPNKHAICRALIVLAAMSWALAVSSGATVQTVCPAGCDYTTIQEALNAAADGDTIEVQVAGAHTEGGIIIDRDVTIAGLGQSVTIVRAAANQATATDRVFLVSGRTVLFTAMTIRNGNSLDNGGGILNQGGIVTLSEVTVSASRANRGGGIYSSSGTLTLDRASITANEAADHGGGLYLAGEMTTINQSVIANNRASDGAGIFQVSFPPAVMTMVDSTIRGNVAEVLGGGASINGWAEIRASTIADNEAEFAGGLYLQSPPGQVALINVTVSGNRAKIHAGGIFVSLFSGISLASVTITGNRAGTDGTNGNGDGGGIFVDRIDMDAGLASLRNTIIAGNLDQNLVGNSADDCFGPLDSQGYNLIGTPGSAGGGPPPCAIAGDPTGNQIGVAAQLGPLADNGGATQTHALAPGSPAIDAGNPAGCNDPTGNPLPADQRGVARVGRCDIGAHEAGTIRIFSNGFEGL